MPKTHPIPQLSIVVPIGRDLARFEATLISVLENQPLGSEVIVPHDGSYDDPFDLCEEVRFVVTDSGHTVDLIGAAAREARGRFVHVLSDGIRATCGWTDAALESFDHFDTAAVVPVIRHQNDRRIVAAGWVDRAGSLCASAFRGETTVDGSSQVGAYLQASFWRRDVLRSLHRAFEGQDSIEASAIYHFLVRQAGWRTELAVDSTVLVDTERLPWETTSLSRGCRLRAIRNHFIGGGWMQSITAGCIAGLASLLHPWSLPEAIGQGLAPLRSGKVASQLHPEEVVVCDDRGMIVSLPQRSKFNAESKFQVGRRAA